jgi:hypothetical protein
LSPVLVEHNARDRLAEFAAHAEVATEASADGDA